MPTTFYYSLFSTTVLRPYDLALSPLKRQMFDEFENDDEPIILAKNYTPNIRIEKSFSPKKNEVPLARRKPRSRIKLLLIFSNFFHKNYFQENIIDTRAAQSRPKGPRNKRPPNPANRRQKAEQGQSPIEDNPPPPVDDKVLEICILCPNLSKFICLAYLLAVKRSNVAFYVTVC